MTPSACPPRTQQVAPDKPEAATARIELEAGGTVCIGGQVCHITAPLGMGSFGVVWAAECESVGEVAVKEIAYHTEAELMRATYEANLLYTLTCSLNPEHACRIPAFVAAELVAASASSEPDARQDRPSCMRLAMTRLAGEPLDRWLHDNQELWHCQGGCGDGIVAAALCLEAGRFAKELIQQLAPALEGIAPFAYHRDVNAHNILISVREAADGALYPQYALVDFGLAVDSTRWMDRDSGNPGGKSEWEFLDVGGDCRYWPASAWLQFEGGCQELAQVRALCQEYQRHLDLQGLGITALQVLAEMLPFSQHSAEQPSGLVEGDGGAATFFPELLVLQQVWSEYWHAATRYWVDLLDTFKNNGDWNVLKNEFVALGVHSIIADRLQTLRQALAEAQLGSHRHGLLSGGLFAALRTLISGGEERAGPTRWAEARTLLEEGEASDEGISHLSAVRTREPFPSREHDGPSAKPAAAPAIAETFPESSRVDTANVLAVVHTLPGPSSAAGRAAPARDDFLERLAGVAAKFAELKRDMQKLEESDRERAAWLSSRSRAWQNSHSPCSEIVAC
jgi:hypothetical protein